MQRVGKRHTGSSRPNWHDGQGQALVELAAIVPIIAIMLLGLVALASAFGAKLSVQAAVAQAARIGALEGNGKSTSASCANTGTPPNTDTIDTDIINAVLSGSIDRNSVRKIDIYRVAPDGSVDSGAIDTYPAPFKANGSPAVYSSPVTLGWPCGARHPDEPSDSIGVHVVYAYKPVVSLPGVSTITIDDRTVVHLNPSKNSQPCPIPGIPQNVAAHYGTSTNQTEPATTDAIVWTPMPGNPAPDRWQISANVNNRGWHVIYDGMTAISTNSSGQLEYDAPNNSSSPVLYQISGHNFCGYGQVSLPASNGQYQLPVAPSITISKADTAHSGQDYLAWTAVPDAYSYTIVQLPSDSATVVPPTTIQVSSLASPSMPSASVTHSGTGPDTYVVYATSLSYLTGPLSSPVSVASTTSPSASVTASFATTASSNVTDLTAAGSAIDWAHWGLNAPPYDFDHKNMNGPPSWIGTYIISPQSKPAAQYTASSTTGYANAAGYTWSGGVGLNATQTSPTYTGVYVAGASSATTGFGYQLKVTAQDTAMHVLHVYVGAINAKIQVSASLGSATYSDSSPSFTNLTNSAVNGVYTLSFRASAINQQLTINLNASPSSATSSPVPQIALQAATLTLAPVATATTYDDDGSSSGGSAAFAYGASPWQHCSACETTTTDYSEGYKDTSTSSNVSGNTLTVKFNGAHIDLYGVKRPDGGYATMSITRPDNSNVTDSGASTDTIDFYAPPPNQTQTRSGSVWMWSSPTLPTLTLGSYKLTLTVSGANNINSNDYYAAIDRVDIQP